MNNLIKYAKIPMYANSHSAAACAADVAAGVFAAFS